MLKTRGIVFRSLKYGETSVIADIFTEEKGLCSFIGGSVRTARARMPYNLFQPMMVVELVAYHREGAGVNRLKEMRAAEVWTGIPFDLKRGAVALFMAEVCRNAIHEEEEHRDMFDFILEHLRWLDISPHPLANLHLHFLLAMSGLLGFPPLPPDEPGEHFFDLREGIFSPVPPPHALIMEPDQVQQMLFLMDAPLESVHELSIPRAQRKTLLSKLLQYYQLHLPGFREVHTPEILDMVI
jgi:DNA repair protein RecO (recombination protein O)